jgi:hypothetical protein
VIHTRLSRRSRCILSVAAAVSVIRSISNCVGVQLQNAVLDFRQSGEDGAIWLLAVHADYNPCMFSCIMSNAESTDSTYVAPVTGLSGQPGTLLCL